MYRHKTDVNTDQIKTRDENRLTHCPHCGRSLTEDEEPEARVRWYVPDDASTPRAAVGAALLHSLRAHGQAVYVSADGKSMRRVGVACAASGERLPTEEREPIIVPPAVFDRDWRPVGHVARPKVRTAGGEQ